MAMSNVSLTLKRLTRRVEMLECSLYALSWKLEELEAENAAQSDRYIVLLHRREFVQDSLNVLHECITSLRKSLH
jgi:hypothetical protein